MIEVAHTRPLFFSMLPQLLTSVSVNRFRSDTLNAVVRNARGVWGCEVVLFATTLLHVLFLGI